VRQNLRDDLRLLDAGNQCKTEDKMIAASVGCSALLVQYAPVGAKVFVARPGIGLASRIGAGYDTIDAKAAQAGVGLDVLPTEPVPAGHPLLADPRATSCSG
jgi:phosphoglycerate dehydrogenase-like enzyme